MKYLIITISLFLLSCAEQSVMKKQELQLINIEKLSNQGNSSFTIKLTDSIIINKNENEMKWQVSLGKRDFKHAVIDKYENNTQKSLRFTKIGSYQVKLGSHRSKAQGAIMMQTLTIIVE